MANLNTFVCASCGHEFVVQEAQKPDCPACGATLKRPAQAADDAKGTPAQPPAAGAGYR